MMRRLQQYDHGATALFIVIFSAMLMTILAVGFMRIMIQEQINATNTDLSQSAYDSALAGVEDAKRVIKSCQNGVAAACDAVTRGSCDTVSAAGIATEQDHEVKVQTKASNGVEMNQAYTCVKIRMNTDDYLASLRGDTSLVIPLRATAPIAKVRIAWQLKGDLPGIALTDPGNKSNLEKTRQNLYTTAEWGPSTPALIRAQFITPSSPNFSLQSLDTGVSGETTFLYPTIVSSVTDLTELALSKVNRVADVGSVFPNYTQLVVCSNPRYALNSNYACIADITLSTPSSSPDALLRLKAFYQNKTSVSVSLFDVNGKAIQFDGVQPAVDSTGRAGNIFRRVESRLSLTGDFNYPENAVDIGGNGSGDFCKNFYVYNGGADAPSTPTCTP
jgi:Tfp pilus assembly protein PilX